MISTTMLLWPVLAWQRTDVNAGLILSLPLGAHVLISWRTDGRAWFFYNESTDDVFILMGCALGLQVDFIRRKR